MKCNRTTLAAALCCMAFASGTSLAADHATSESGSNMGNTSSSTMNRGGSTGAGSSGYHAGSMDQQTVRQVQQALSDKGHNPGPIDGIMGPRTRSALQDYQRAQNITGTGLDSRTLESLGVQARSGMGSDSGSSAGGTSGAYGGSGGTTSGSGSSGMGADGHRGGTSGSDANRSGAGSATSPSGSGASSPAK